MNPKGPKDRLMIVPWFNPAQFIKVYKYLYSNSLVKKRWAVDQISVWNTRCHPSLPAAIEATNGLVSAQIQEMLYISGKTINQELDIQFAYCTALTRFVTLVLEHHQKASSKISLSVLAAKHNIPSWVIDLRNEAVHSYLPTLTALTMGAKSALQYLDETFWSKESKNKRQIIYHYPKKWEEEALDLINRYKDLQFQRIKEESLKLKLGKSLKAVLKKISSFIFHDRERFIDILVRPGNFISVEDVEKFLYPQDISQWFEDRSLSVPIKLQKFWLPLLSNIQNKEIMPMFLEKLLFAQEDCRNKLCQKLAISWSREIFLGPASTSLLEQCFRKMGLLICTPTLLYACMKSATPYTKELLDLILAKEKNKQKYTKLYFILALYQGHFVSADEPSFKRKRDTDLDIIFTMEDVEEELNEERAKKMRTEGNESTSNWSMAPADMDFSKIPFGAILNPVVKDGSEDEQSSWKDQIKLEPSVDDDFIFGENVDPATVEDITDNENTFTEITIPEDFDMVYRPNQVSDGSET